MSLLTRLMLAPLSFVFGRLLFAEKLAWNPLYSIRLYKSTKAAPSRGTYNFYLLSLVVFCMIAWAGGLNWTFCLFLVASVLSAMLIDPLPWSQKVSATEMPRQVWYYLHLLLQAMRADLLPLVVITTLLYGVVKPLTRPFDVMNGYTLYALYGVYLTIRTIMYFRYLYIVLFRWESHRSPPFEIHKANLRDRKAAVIHLTWSFLLGNVGLVVRCGYYGMIVYLLDGFYSFVGYPVLSGTWGIALVVVAFALWFLLADERLLYPYYKAHRALHENPALYTSVHRIHHYAVYPTLLDAGTISPAELLVTESTAIWFAPLPDWLWFTFQIWAAIAHFAGHHTKAEENDTDEHFQFHVLHHRLYHCNYGFPSTDEKFKTLEGIS